MSSENPTRGVPEDPPRATYIVGESDDLRSMLDAFEARTEGVISLASEVRTLVVEVRDLGEAVASRPPREEVDLKRRRTIAALAVYGFALIFLQDQHVENCGPGARAEKVIVAVAAQRAPEPGRTQGESSLAKIQRIIAETEQSPLCDVTFPLHGHEERGYPSGWGVLGLLLYGGAGGGLAYWANRPGFTKTTRNRRADDPKE